MMLCGPQGVTRRSFQAELSTTVTMPRTREKCELGVSIMICCHNGAARLPETLAHLSRQKVDPGIPWEVLIVDNASTDDTAPRARQLWPESAPAPLRIIPEPQQGKPYACLRGLNEARYEFLGIIDDDNWPRRIGWKPPIRRCWLTPM